MARASGNGGAGVACRDGRAVLEIGDRRGQHLARQRQVDRPLGLGHRQVDGAIDRGFEHVRVGQLVVPFDELAHDAALVAHLLRPVDLAGARSGDAAGLAVGRAPRCEQHRDVAAPGVEQAGGGVGGADVDVHHDQLRPTGLQVVALRHRHRDVLVRAEHRLGERLALGFRLGQRLDQGGEIGARVGEQTVDAAVGEEGHIGVGGAPRLDGLDRHGRSPSSARCHCGPAPRVLRLAGPWFESVK